MNKFKSKKGFTLAELLIVVAIIAVLVAIAVPLFVSGLQKAQDARDAANIRAVKSAAIVQILNTEATDANKGTGKVYKADGTLQSFFTVVAHLDANGNITDTKLTITSTDTDPTKPAGDTATAAKDTAEAQSGGGWTVTCYLTALDLKG